MYKKIDTCIYVYICIIGYYTSFNIDGTPSSSIFIFAPLLPFDA